MTANPARPLLMGIDVGTASSKGVLTTLSGEVWRRGVLARKVVISQRP